MTSICDFMFGFSVAWNFDWRFDRDHPPKWILHPFVICLHLRESTRRVITEAREGVRPYEKQSLLPTFISGGILRRTKAESRGAAKNVSNIKKKKGLRAFFVVCRFWSHKIVLRFCASACHNEITRTINQRIREISYALTKPTLTLESSSIPTPCKGKPEQTPSQTWPCFFTCGGATSADKARFGSHKRK